MKYTDSQINEINDIKLPNPRKKNNSLGPNSKDFKLLSKFSFTVIDTSFHRFNNNLFFET